MSSVEKTESTLEIFKLTSDKLSFIPNEVSKGLSSGHLEVIKTESELCLRPGSPDRYKPLNNFEYTTPHTKISSPLEPSSDYSFQDIMDLENINQTPDKNLSLSLEFNADDMPDKNYSFFSAAEAKEIQIFSYEKEKVFTFNSFASTNSKTDKFLTERLFKQTRMKNYQNRCKVECGKCLAEITTEIKMIYPDASL